MKIVNKREKGAYRNNEKTCIYSTHTCIYIYIYMCISVRTVVRTPSLTLPATARTAVVYLRKKSGPSPYFCFFKRTHEVLIDFDFIRSVFA